MSQNAPRRADLSRADRRAHHHPEDPARTDPCRFPAPPSSRWAPEPEADTLPRPANPGTGTGQAGKEVALQTVTGQAGTWNWGYAPCFVQGSEVYFWFLFCFYCYIKIELSIIYRHVQRQRKMTENKGGRRTAHEREGGEAKRRRGEEPTGCRKSAPRPHPTPSLPAQSLHPGRTSLAPASGRPSIPPHQGTLPPCCVISLPNYYSHSFFQVAPMKPVEFTICLMATTRRGRPQCTSAP